MLPNDASNPLTGVDCWKMGKLLIPDRGQQVDVYGDDDDDGARLYGSVLVEQGPADKDIREDQRSPVQLGVKRYWLILSRVSRAIRAAASAKFSSPRGCAYRLARDQLIIIPEPLAVRPAFTVASISPPCAPMPGTSKGMSPTIARTCASSCGKVAPTTRPH